MLKYTIYCTPEQTKKALDLGAPIETFDISSIEGKSAYNFPTAEQMIGWLEEKRVYIKIGKSFIADYQSLAYNGKETAFYSGYFPSRKEATLAALDAALEYLSNNYESH